MKIALVDDDQMCLDEMAKLCHDFGVTHGCKVETFPFIRGDAFLKTLETEHFSVVFMDIYMDGMDGISVAASMRVLDNRCILVFLTSSTDFMPEAFSCHAFEYITKPFSQERVSKVLTDALEVLSPAQKYMELTSGRKTVRLFFDEITFAITDAHYLNIGLADGTMLRSRMTMSQFIEQAGDEERFLPINKGITVNADYILKFEHNCCMLENGARFPVRVRDRLKIEQAAHDYHFRKIRRLQRHKKED